MSKNTKKSGNLKSISGGNGNGKGPYDSFPNESSGVIDLTAARAQRQTEDRRSVERYFLQHMIDVICETDERTGLSLQLIEIGEDGCSFRLSAEKAKLLPKDTAGHWLPVRAKFYFSRDSFMVVGLHIKHATPEIGNGTQAVKFGCQIDSTFASSAAFQAFWAFMRAYTAVCLRDSRQVSGF